MIPGAGVTASGRLVYRAAAMRDSAPILPASLRRKILFLIAVKLIALGLIYWFFFSHGGKDAAFEAATEAQILSPVTQSGE
jgi:hypothetical protein